MKTFFNQTIFGCDPEVELPNVAKLSLRFPPLSPSFLQLTQRKTIKDMEKIMTFAISEGLTKMGNNQEICQ